MKHLNDDDFDENGILKDGHSLRVPMFMADGTSARPLITDASGNGGHALHRPGYRISSNDAARDAKQRARDAYENDLVNAWRSSAKRDTEAPRRAKEDAGDGLSTDARERAYQTYDAELQSAWRSR